MESNCSCCKKTIPNGGPHSPFTKRQFYFILLYPILFYLCMCMCVRTHSHTCLCLLIYLFKAPLQCPQMSGEGVGQPGVGVIGSCKPWVLETKPRSPVKAGNALPHHHLLSPGHTILLSSPTAFALLASFSSSTSLPYLSSSAGSQSSFGLELTMYTKLVLNSSRSTSLRLPRAESKGVCHHTWLGSYYAPIY